MVYALRRQPFRALYISLELILTLAARSPLWILQNLFKSWRPRPSWTLRQTFMVNLVRLASFLGPLAARAGPLDADPDHRTLLNDTKGTKGVWIPPVPHLVVGDVKTWADQGNIESVRIPGYWHSKEELDAPLDQPRTTGEKVIYVIHGGGFIGGSSGKDPWRDYIIRLSQCHPSVQRCFAVDYRLTTGPPLEALHPFPTALIDTLAGYSYLINDVGFDPQDIIISGDSAGANLAVALVRYLLETRSDPAFNHIPCPGPPLGLALHSPWVDLGDSHDGPDKSQRKFLPSDYLLATDSPLFTYARVNYCRILSFPQGANSNRYLSPASTHLDMETVSFKGFPKTFITYADAEMLYDQGVTLDKMLRRDIGDDNVFTHITKDGCHDIVIVAFWEPERTNVFRAVERWLGGIIPPVRVSSD